MCLQLSLSADRGIDSRWEGKSEASWSTSSLIALWVAKCIWATRPSEMYVWEILFRLCCWFWNPDVMLTPVSRIPSLSHATYSTSLWSLNIAMCIFAHLQVASIDRRAENRNMFPCSLWLSLIHAWLTHLLTHDEYRSELCRVEARTPEALRCELCCSLLCWD